MLSEKFFLPKALIWMTRVVWCAKCRIPFYKVCKEMFQKLIYGYFCIFTRSYRVFYMRLAWIWLVSNFSYISTIWDAVWHCLYNLKNEKNTCGGVLLSKSNTPPWVYSRFSNCTNDTKSHKISHILFNLTMYKRIILNMSFVKFVLVLIDIVGAEITLWLISLYRCQNHFS